MFSLKKNLLIALGMVVLVVVGLVTNNGQIGSAPDSAGPKNASAMVTGDLRIRAPDFTLMTLEGDRINSKDFRGNVVLINFWATWCGPCRAEIPGLVRLKEKHRKEGFDILAVAIQSGTPEEISKFATEFNINYWILTSENESDVLHVTDLYGKAVGVPITGIPTTFLVDQDGYIRRWYVGARSEAEFWNDIKEFL